MNDYAPYKDRKEHDYINTMTIIVGRLYSSIAQGEKAIKEAKDTMNMLKQTINEHVKFAQRERGPQMKVVVAAYVHNKKFINALISLWTWLPNPKTPPVSHIEIGMMKDDKFQFFSSTNRGGVKGTRWASLEKVIKHPERWIFYEKYYPAPEVKEMIDRANGIIPSPYDWLGIGGFATVTGQLNAKNKWYCSEACWFVLIWEWIKRISPRYFIKRILGLGFKKCTYEKVLKIAKQQKRRVV